MQEDTISAIATPLGEGAIGIVRISGPDAEAVGRRLFDRPLRDRGAVFGRMLEAGTRKPIDEGIAVLMRGPRSFTGEDTVEFNGHGGLRSLRRLFEATLAGGARAAVAGEFTLRAFLNGRLDLTQAESVLDLVRARTDGSVELALAGLEGRLKVPIREARARALETLAYLGARADFPDEDVPLRDIGPELDDLVRRLDDLVAGAEFGIIQSEGVRIAIVGRPNAGKSSLLNQLLRAERAIVSEVPGTTRDTIEQSANLLGLPAVYVDTAGIRETLDPVERIGVERSRAAAGGSDIVLLVVDGSCGLTDEDRGLLHLYQERNLIVALNKTDLGAAISPSDADLGGISSVPISALTGEGLDALQRALRAAAVGTALPPVSGAALSTSRQREAARRSAVHIRAARDGYASATTPEDLLAVDIGAAVRALGELTGEDATEDLLDAIFSRFCIGK